MAGFTQGAYRGPVKGYFLHQSAHQGSNLEPPAYQAGALTTFGAMRRSARQAQTVGENHGSRPPGGLWGSPRTAEECFSFVRGNLPSPLLERNGLREGWSVTNDENRYDLGMPIETLKGYTNDYQFRHSSPHPRCLATPRNRRATLRLRRLPQSHRRPSDGTKNPRTA